MAQEKILYLTLKKKWFDMILSWEKKEEYRDIKQYWESRLIESGSIILCDSIIYERFTHVVFTNGYGSHLPSFKIECNGIKIGSGQSIWGANTSYPYFVISLGEIIESKNC
jgi:hypothetical protein